MYKNLDRFFFRFVTMHAFDRQTDGQTEISSLDGVCIPSSAVNIETATHTINKCGVLYLGQGGDVLLGVRLSFCLFVC